MACTSHLFLFWQNLLFGDRITGTADCPRRMRRRSSHCKFSMHTSPWMVTRAKAVPAWVSLVENLKCGRKQTRPVWSPWWPKSFPATLPRVHNGHSVSIRVLLKLEALLVEKEKSKIESNKIFSTRLSFRFVSRACGQCRHDLGHQKQWLG